MPSIVKEPHELARQNLMRILQNAYSGEIAAAYAYRGHWKSLKDSPERTEIKKIEARSGITAGGLANGSRSSAQNRGELARKFSGRSGKHSE